MKFTFCLSSLEYPDVDCDKSIYPIGWVLTDNARPELCDEILQEIKKFKESSVEWEMSYNKSVLCLSEKGVTCIDALNESVESILTLDRFESLVKKWKSFVSKPTDSVEVEV
ncbi:hypothetical protein QFX18_12745 [Saccharophagus degradans]|uniref:hypothetical protein n=1 Tax=Saccharophagus degradans TaxID=86304 RepID=UPI00247814DA|nr:hypothetical protein [Saccharophagus degradans]WGO96914.1 hypothetical protein QFX18_12745 [Saccharophagus degradans]